MRKQMIVFFPDGSQPVEVTEEVKVLLDRISSSLDWGSGFLDVEELEAWKKVARCLEVDLSEVDRVISERREFDNS